MFAHVRSQNLIVNLFMTLGDADDTTRDDAMARVDDDDEVGPGQEMVHMEISRGFRLEASNHSS